MIISAGFFGRAINSITDDDVRVSKRLYVASKRLRGFEPGKIGPVDGGDFIGGNYATSVNIQTSIPQLLPNIQNMDVSMFLDAGNRDSLIGIYWPIYGEVDLRSLKEDFKNLSFALPATQKGNQIILNGIDWILIETP